MENMDRPLTAEEYRHAQRSRVIHLPPKPKHVGHWLEWVRTIAPCCTLAIQVVILIKLS